MKRRTFFSISTSTTASVAAGSNPLLKYLCPPDNLPPDLATPSPAAKAFVTPLFIPPIMENVTELDPAPDPSAHQLYAEHPPKKFYETSEVEMINWQYHTEGCYTSGSVSWGYKSHPHPASTPGPTYKAWYNEPVLVRRSNDLPSVGNAKVTWALPSTSSHLHNGHTASESDGNPQDWIDSGEFWDHHYGNFPSGNDPTEKLTTLWYHDHRLDFTAANVYAGLAGFYFLFDEEDTGYENPTPDEQARLKELFPNTYDPEKAWKLPSGDYDIPLILQDIMFFKDETGNAQVRWDAWNTAGILGDMYTVNRKIRPVHKVERRRYRFRILNGGPSRFYQLAMVKYGDTKPIPLTTLTGDGNFLPEPIEAENIYLSVAQRVDVIVDFSEYEPGDKLVLVNRLEQIHGAGPSGQVFDIPPDPAWYEEQGVVCFEVGDKAPEDPTWTIPEIHQKIRRKLPIIDLSEVTQERLWTFDYDGGLWTINGRIMEANRIDAGIAKNSTEIWTLRNTGNDWSHPIHCHFTEFLILEVNGKPFYPHQVQTVDGAEIAILEYLQGKAEKRKPVEVYLGGPRRDVATILPYDEMKVFLRFRDFIGKHVMHCHNVVHEDHAMMIRWDMLPEGIEPFGVGTTFKQGLPQEAKDIFGDPTHYSYPNPRISPVQPHLEERPGQATPQ